MRTMLLKKIQPFTFGNELIGRVLVNYFLMINDLPPIIIYNEDKSIFAYYSEAKGVKGNFRWRLDEPRGEQ